MGDLFLLSISVEFIDILFTCILLLYDFSFFLLYECYDLCFLFYWELVCFSNSTILYLNVSIILNICWVISGFCSLYFLHYMRSEQTQSVESIVGHPVSIESIITFERVEHELVKDND